MVSIIRKTAPCQQACPAGVDVPRYVRHTRDGRWADALAVVRERIPFPLVCGAACFHPCEAKCSRAQLDEPVSIRMLKRVAAELGTAAHPASTVLPATGRKCAVVGSGPCGLTAAYYLAQQGHAVTVLEAAPRSGGMLRYGIPAYRLPDEMLDSDVRAIEASGVEIRTGSHVPSAEALLAQCFHAVLVATGAWRSRELGVPGEKAPHVIQALALLGQVNRGAAPELGRRVVVIGGGNAAIDAARVCRRLGAEVVQLYRRTRAEMPASAEEVDAALLEGVHIEYLHAPVRIDTSGVVCVRMALGAPDASGRSMPVPIAGSEYLVPASSVVLAIGQDVELPSAALPRTRDGRAAADAHTLATSTPGLFAAGDAVLGPSTIIDAIAQGRRAAVAIDRHLGGTGEIDRPDAPAISDEAPAAAPRGSARHPHPEIPVAQRVAGFALVEQAYDAATARREAARCMSCDLQDYMVSVNAAACKECGYCHEVCATQVFTTSAQLNAAGYAPAIAAHPERCMGCLNCLYICPDFAITVSQQRCPTALPA